MESETSVISRLALKKELRSKERSIAQFSNWATSYNRDIWGYYFRYTTNKALGFFNYNNANILDLGCATGDLCIKIAQHFSPQSVVGIDITPKMIEFARSRLALSPFKNTVSFILADAEKIPYEKDYFDYVFCLNAFHHFPNSAEVIQEVKRVLKKGGKFIFLDPYKGGILRSIWVFLLKVWFGESYAKYYTKNEIISIVTNEGLKVESVMTLLYFTQFVIITKTNG